MEDKAIEDKSRGRGRGLTEEGWRHRPGSLHLPEWWRWKPVAPITWRSG